MSADAAGRISMTASATGSVCPFRDRRARQLAALDRRRAGAGIAPRAGDADLRRQARNAQSREHAAVDVELGRERDVLAPGVLPAVRALTGVGAARAQHVVGGVRDGAGMRGVAADHDDAWLRL